MLLLLSAHVIWLWRRVGVSLQKQKANQKATVVPNLSLYLNLDHLVFVSNSVLLESYYKFVNYSYNKILAGQYSVWPRCFAMLQEIPIRYPSRFSSGRITRNIAPLSKYVFVSHNFKLNRKLCKTVLMCLCIRKLLDFSFFYLRIFSF